MIQKLIVLLNFSYYLASSTIAHSQPTTSTCIDNDQANSAITSFKWADQKGPITDFSSRLCEPKDIFYKTVEALVFLKSLTNLNDKKDDLNPNTIGSNPFDYFKTRVAEIIFDSKNTRICTSGVALAYVILNTNSVHICPKSLESSLLELAVALIHESRHVEGYGHVLCDHGDLEGSRIPSCDESYEKRGSYGIDTEFQIRLSRTDGISDSLRQEARAGAVARLLNRFNKYPFDIKAGVFGQTLDNRLLFFSENDVSNVSKKTKSENLINFLGRPAWYDKKTELVYSPNYSDGFIAMPGGVVNQINDIFKVDQSDLIDFYYNFNDKYVCMLSERKLYCTVFLGKDVRKVEFELPDVGISFIYLKDFKGIKLNGDQTLNVPSLTELMDTSFQQLTVAQVKTPYRNVITWNAGEITYNLDSNGTVYFGKGVDAQTAPIHSNSAVKKIIGPLLWSKRFDEI